MMNLRTRVLAAMSIIVMTACSSSDNNFSPPAAPPPLSTAKLRIVHASADAPNVDVVGPLSTFSSDLSFKEATEFLTFPARTVNLRVNAALPGGMTTVIGPVDLALSPDTAYSVIALGQAAAIDALVIAEPVSSVASDSVRAQVVHAAPLAPAVDVYVTAPGADLTQSAPLGGFAFGESLGPVTVPAGDYQIRVTLANSSADVVLDSGTVSLPGAADLLLVAVQNTGPGAAPISLLVTDGSQSFEILDVATPAELRVIHASPDAPSVDVVVDDDFANPVLSGVSFPAFSEYLPIPSGAYNVKVTAAGNPGAIVIDADLSLEAGTRYSVYASGPLATIAPLVLVDDNRPVATEAKVRIVHVAPSAGLVDVYVTAVGADIATLSPNFASVGFGANTGLVSLEGGTYDVTVTAAGTKTVAIGPATITISDGSVYTAAARDAVGGGSPFGLILLDDFNP